MNYYLLLGLSLFVYMTVWFLISILIKRNDIADIAWGLGFVFLAWLGGFFHGLNVKSIIVNLLITVWGLRLSFHIFLRNYKKDEDYRYKKWREEWKNFYLRSFFQIYLLQGVLLYLIVLPALFINNSIFLGFKLSDLIGIFIWLFGFCFETVADYQLKKFISDRSNKGKIMNKGLWRYSRHPNYFGEVTLWWGIFIIALSLPNGFLTIVGPLTISFLILFVSGIPLLEKKYQGRKDFEEYKRKTSVFFPLPPKS